MTDIRNSANWGFETKQVHIGQEEADPATGARAVPIYASASFVFRDCCHAEDLFALRDTGNTLLDPETGRVVCVVEEKALEPLLSECNILYRKIPFQSLGQSRGELLCFTCENLSIENAALGAYPVGLADHPLTDGGGYVGLWGGEKGGNGAGLAS